MHTASTVGKDAVLMVSSIRLKVLLPSSRNGGMFGSMKVSLYQPDVPTRDTPNERIIDIVWKGSVHAVLLHSTEICTLRIRRVHANLPFRLTSLLDPHLAGRLGGYPRLRPPSSNCCGRVKRYPKGESRCLKKRFGVM